MQAAKESEEGSVEVFIRLQPPQAEHLIRSNEKTVQCLANHYNFDYVFPHFATQNDLFMKAGVKLIMSAKKGYNSCIFAYGQTGSGKTYTMTGNQESDGIVQKSMKKLWQILQDFDSFELRLSYFEIYNQQVNDLLLSKRASQIKIKQSLTLGFYLENLQQIKIENYEDLIHNLQKGIKNRRTASTNMNSQSSRSHSILTFYVNTREKNHNSDTFSIKSSKIHFVDLAGSQKQKLTSTAGQRLKQASSINKSLTSLSIVIEKLSNKATHIPYRDSVLTKILRDSLGGNSKTILIATVSSKESSLSETVSTLNFAVKAKKVRLAARINEEFDGSAVNLQKRVKQLEQEIRNLKLKEYCASCTNVKVENQKLEEQNEQMREELKEAKRKLFELQMLASNRSNFSDQQEEHESLKTIAEESQQQQQSTKYKCLKLGSQNKSKSSGNSRLKFDEKQQNQLLKSELKLKMLQIEALNTKLREVEQADDKMYRPLVDKFTSSLGKMKMKQCEMEIFMAQFYKLKQIKSSFRIEQESWDQKSKVYESTIQNLKSIFEEMRKQMGSNDEHVGKSKEKSSERNWREQLQAQEIYQQELRKQVQSDRIEIDRLEGELQQKEDIVKYWQEKYNAMVSKGQQKDEWIRRELQIAEKHSLKQQKQQKQQKQLLELELSTTQRKLNESENVVYNLREERENMKKTMASLGKKIECLQTDKEELFKSNTQLERRATRVQQNMEIKLSEYNRALASQRKEMDQLAKESSRYFMECLELRDEVKKKNYSIEALHAANLQKTEKLNRLTEKLKHFHQKIAASSNDTYDYNQLLEEKQLLQNKLLHCNSRLDLLKSQYIRKNDEISQWKQKYAQEKKWAEQFKKMQEDFMSGRKNTELVRTGEYWQLAQAQKKISEIASMISKMCGMKLDEKNLLAQIDEVKDKIQEICQVREENKVLKAKIKLLTEQRSSDFFKTLLIE